MSSILAKIRRKMKRSTCFWVSAIGFAGVFLELGAISSGLYDNLMDDGFTTKFSVFTLFCYLIFGILFLAAGLYDSDRDESSAARPPRFYTVNEDGAIVLKEADAILAKDHIGYKETRRADGKVDISMEIHSKEQALEVLAALAVMHDKGDIADTDYNYNVRKIREHFDL